MTRARRPVRQAWRPSLVADIVQVVVGVIVVAGCIGGLGLWLLILGSLGAAP